MTDFVPLSTTISDRGAPLRSTAEDRRATVQRSCCGMVNVGEGERLGSIVGGGMLVLAGLTTRSWLRWVLMGIGGSLVFRGATGHCFGYQALDVDTSHRNQYGIASGRGVHISHSVIVNRPPAELFDTWRHFERLPEILSHVSEVRNLGNNRTHWVAETPFGTKLSWNAQSITRDDARTISWRSEPGAVLRTAGTIHFDDAPGGRGTEVHLSMDYDIPGGVMAERVADWFGSSVKECAIADLRDFKRKCEADAVAHSPG